MPNITTNHAITYTNLSHEPRFLCWDHSVAGMKTVDLPPSFSRTNYHTFSSSLVPFLIFFISTTGTVRFSRRFHPQSTPDNSNLQGKSRSKENGTTSASRKLKPLLPHLRRPCVNLLTQPKLVSRKWIRIRFILSSPLKYS